MKKKKNNVNENSTSYLTFKMNNETFAVNVAHVQIILEVSKITKVPKTEDYFLGVIDFRDYVLSLIDMRIKLGLEIQENTVNTCILVIEINKSTKIVQFGILVDAVEEVIEIKQEKIQPPPSIGSKINSEIIEGMYKHVNEDFIIILDINRIFMTDKLDKIIIEPSEALTA